MTCLETHLQILKTSRNVGVLLRLTETQKNGIPPAGLETFLSDVGAIIERYGQSEFAPVPAADGMLFLSLENASTEIWSRLHANASALQQEIEACFRAIAQGTVPDALRIDLIGSPAQEGLTHEAFLDLPPQERARFVRAALKRPPADRPFYVRNHPGAAGSDKALYPAHSGLSDFREPKSPSVRNPRFVPHPDYLITDLHGIRSACSEIETLFGAGDLHFVYCSVHFATLRDDRYWPVFKADLEAILPFYLPFLRFEIVGIPPDTPQGLIVAAAETLGPSVRYVSVCLNGTAARSLHGDGAALAPADETAFFIPENRSFREQNEILRDVAAYAAEHQTRSAIGLRNARFGFKPQLDHFTGAVFPNKDDATAAKMMYYPDTAFLE